MAGVGVLVAVNIAATSTAFVVATASAYVVVILVSIAVHEAGHALAAASLGYRVVRIVTGSGPCLVSGRIGRTDVELRLLPAGGVTHLAARDANASSGGLRIRHFVAVLAGPAATIALAIWGPALVPDDWGVWHQVEDGVVGGNIDSIVSGVNFWLAVVNLFPRGGTDGATMWWLLTSRDEDVDDLGDLLGAAEAGLHAMEGDLDRALSVSAGVDANSENTAAVSTRAGALIMAGHFAEGRELLLGLLDHPMPTLRQAVVANNLAWAAVNLGDADLLPEADHWSERAVAILSDREPTVLHTRGRVLVELGRTDEALALVDEALRLESQGGENRGEMLATRALALLSRGDALGARGDIDEAVRLAPQSRGVRDIRSRVDVRSLRVVAQGAEISAKGLVALPDALRSPAAQDTREGARRAIESGDAEAVADALAVAEWRDHVADSVEALRAALGEVSRSRPPSVRSRG